MKLIYTFFLSFLVIGAFAQQSNPLEFLHNDTLFAKVDTNNMTGNSFVAEGKLKNISTGSLKLKWKRTFLQLPSDCSSYVCDINCYDSSVNTCPTTLNLTPGQELPFSMHFEGSDCCAPGNAGSIAKVTFHPSSDLNTTLLTTYWFCNSTTSSYEISKESVRVGPNPTTEYLILTDRDDRVNQINIYSLTGRISKSFKVNGNNEFYVGDLNQGLYFVKLLDKNNKVIKTIKVQKLNP